MEAGGADGGVGGGGDGERAGVHGDGAGDAGRDVGVEGDGAGTGLAQAEGHIARQRGGATAPDRVRLRRIDNQLDAAGLPRLALRGHKRLGDDAADCEEARQTVAAAALGAEGGRAVQDKPSGQDDALFAPGGLRGGGMEPEGRPLGKLDVLPQEGLIASVMDVGARLRGHGGAVAAEILPRGEGQLTVLGHFQTRHGTLGAEVPVSRRDDIGAARGVAAVDGRATRGGGALGAQVQRIALAVIRDVQPGGSDDALPHLQRSHAIFRLQCQGERVARRPRGLFHIEGLHVGIRHRVERQRHDVAHLAVEADLEGDGVVEVRALRLHRRHVRGAGRGLALVVVAIPRLLGEAVPGLILCLAVLGGEVEVEAAGGLHAAGEEAGLGAVAILRERGCRHRTSTWSPPQRRAPTRPRKPDPLASRSGRAHGQPTSPRRAGRRGR